jgi:S-(hydroxymethyl)mycothiol dehydrogenase
MRLTMPLIDFFSHGGALTSSWYGDWPPSRDSPMLIDLYPQACRCRTRQRTGRLGDVEAASGTVRRGEGATFCRRLLSRSRR